MAAFGAFSVAVAIYAGYQISKIDQGYSELLTGEAAAATNIIRMNRSLQAARASIAENIMSRTDELKQAASDDLAKNRKDFETSADLALAATPADKDLSALKSAGLNLLDASCRGTIEAGKTAVSDAGIEAAKALFLSECQPGFRALSNEFIAKSTATTNAALARSDLLTDQSESTIWTTITLVLLGLILVVVAGFVAIRAWLVLPIKSLAGLMVQLASGDLTPVVLGTDRRDEVGGMAKAVQVFKENGLKARQLEAEAVEQRSLTEEERRRNAELERARAQNMADATAGLAKGLKHLASGDLTYQLEQTFAAEFESLRADFNAAVNQLAQTMSAVARATTLMDGGTREISQSAQDLAKRTEQQAASLEETAAALDQITTNVANSSKRAEEARSIAAQANASAAQSGDVVAKAVDAMQRIEQSSDQIANIIGVIDEIAFQTNLLALNAGVEAARAGEAGKGFAVVAQEVRELAQRSAQAAKEIKGLIQNSSVEVAGGVKLVSETGQALRAIETHIITINQHMDAIALSSREQAVGLAEVNTAVNQMDQVTQQNAAMVEESNAASSSLAGEAGKLQGLVGQFQLPANGASRAFEVVDAATGTLKPTPSPAHRLAGRVSAAFGATAAIKSSWEEF